MRLDKFTTKFQEALGDAQSLALGNDNAYIEPVHLLVAMLRQDDGPRALLERAGANVPATSGRRSPGCVRWSSCSRSSSTPCPTPASSTPSTATSEGPCRAPPVVHSVFHTCDYTDVIHPQLWVTLWITLSYPQLGVTVLWISASGSS